MPQDDGARPSARPRSKAFLKIDLQNAYAQLGVSPLASPDEITDRINNLLGQARKRVRSKAAKDANDPDEAEILRLQKIDHEIGDAKRRIAYDERHPQNVLLTVQPGGTEQARLRYRRAGLISEWIYDLVGESTVTPTPRCLCYWAPKGIEPALLDFLTKYAEAPSEPGSAASPPAEGAEPQLSIADLERFQERD